LLAGGEGRSRVEEPSRAAEEPLPAAAEKASLVRLPRRIGLSDVVRGLAGRACERVAPLLPLQGRFRVRFVAEVRLAPDPAEAHAAALRVLALARTVPSLRR
jgi:hypothetical protein